MATTKYKRGTDGYFTARVWDGTYTDGKKHYTYIRSKKSSKDLENKVTNYRSDVAARNNVRKTDATFLEYARQWKKLYKDSRGANTKEMYENIIEKHFISIQTVKLCEVDRVHLQLLLNNASGKSRTQQQIYMTFKQVLKSAAADKLFPSNVMEDIFQGIERPKYISGKKRPLTDYERDAVFKADFKEQDKIFVYILYGCGLRRSEALALTVFNINLKTHELTVNKAHELTKNHPVQKDPKSARGNRTVPIPDKIFPAVRSWVEYRRARGKTYLFTMRSGEPISKSSYDKMWARIVRQMQKVSEHDITGLTAHVFRHNYCTNLCYQIPTVSIKRIAALLGDSEKMVLDVYNHVVLEKENAVGAVNAAIG